MENNLKFELLPLDQERINRLSGPTNSTYKQIEKELDIKIINRGGNFKIQGSKGNIKAGHDILVKLYKRLGDKDVLSPEEIHLFLREVMNKNNKTKELDLGRTSIKTPKVTVLPKGKNQEKYLKTIKERTLTFCVGPAGTGKTYLAVALAVEQLRSGEVEKIVVTRPAVEAGEKLGFLPGDLSQKVDPYLRPLYDALFETLGIKETNNLIEGSIIEIAPLAFMRGRTLSNAFIILDEGQNTTREQMKMFLTRFGYGSRVVVTGDLTQVDLPRDSSSGLFHALEVLKTIKEVGFLEFNSRDVIRNSLVQKIVEAYDRYKA
ncbi:MAG: PhoH family protein [Gammaproteobacteria bacterium]